MYEYTIDHHHFSAPAADGDEPEDHGRKIIAADHEFDEDNGVLTLFDAEHEISAVFKWFDSFTRKKIDSDD